MSRFRRTARLHFAAVGIVMLMAWTPVAGALVLPAPIHAIRVDGAHIVNQDGTRIVLDGVNRAGTEYACAQGWGVFDGPSGPSTIESMKTWAVNVVRVPLNEDCWLGVNVPPKFSGAVYRHAIVQYLAQLRAAGLVAILDLHWSAPGSSKALGQQAMPDRSHSKAFWASVARTFRSDSNVAFELYNEPHDVTWACWHSGCAMPGGWRSVGMQTLISTVRQTGATQPIVVDGLDWANNLSGWSTHPLVDPLHQLVAALHVYSWNACVTTSCWDGIFTHIASSVPIITTEVGERDCSGSFITQYLNWAGPHGVSALAWTWNNNEGCLSLLKDPSSGTTAYGTAVRNIFRLVAAR
jgi:endoglucanase